MVHTDLRNYFFATNTQSERNTQKMIFQFYEPADVVFTITLALKIRMIGLSLLFFSFIVMRMLEAEGGHLIPSVA